MRKRLIKSNKGKHLPVFLEKDEDGFYIVECPVFRGCYTQGKTIDEALTNIREVIDLCLEETENQKVLKSYFPTEISLHTVSV
ncbi:MAG TPA: type II toxin-antitoxin system HicB family antitoxin [Candidatus Paceibacterota bacterium]